MHEASLVQGLLNLAERSLEEYNSANPSRKAARIRDIRCTYGLLSCFEPQTLKACFEIFSENTRAEKARLTLQIEPLPCECGNCGASFKLTRRKFICPECGSENLSFTGGNGLTLQAIEVDEDNPDD